MERFLVFDMFVMQNYADISTKTTTGGCFLKTATGRLEMFMRKTYRFGQASKACGIPT